MILVDTNVLLDVVSDDPVWANWSQSALESGAATDELAINDIVYAELSIGFDRIEDVERVLATAGLSLVPTPKAALFLAGKAHRRYRSLGGTRPGVLPDFFIGAHAVVTGARLLTRDAPRYRTYFPSVAVITP